MSNFFVSSDFVHDEWAKDSVIDKTNLAEESIKVDQLIGKYLKFWEWANRDCRRTTAELKRLKLDKFEFYTKGPSKERRPNGWRQAPQGALTKTEAPVYVDADPDVLIAVDKVGAANDLVSVLDNIISTLKQRSHNIRNALGSEKFFAGLDR